MPTEQRLATRGNTTRIVFACAVICAVTKPVYALDNGLGRLPPLGWSSWNYFATEINETLIMEMADAMVSTGLRDVGYEYINVDAGYLQHGRDPTTGKLVVNKARFPSGMRKLADYIHSKKLKLGVYTDLTDRSCGPGPGSGGHYSLDAKTFALEWDADYLKVDYCGSSVSRDPAPQYAGFASLRDALNHTGKAIYYSICPHTHAVKSGPSAAYHGATVYAPPAQWTAPQRHDLANSILVEFTNTFDLWYADPVPGGDGGPMREPGGIITNIDAVTQMTNQAYSAPGSWNDADMLQLCTFGEGATRHRGSTGKPGNLHGQGMTMAEYESHLAVWAILPSPLIQSADLRTVGSRHPECLALMLNREVIAVNQDPAGHPATLLMTETNVTGRSAPGNYSEANSTQVTAQVWGRRLSRGRSAAVLLNRGEQSRELSISLDAIGVARGAVVTVRDVLTNKDLGTARNRYSVTVGAHASVFVVFTPNAEAQ